MARKRGVLKRIDVGLAQTIDDFANKKRISMREASREINEIIKKIDRKRRKMIEDIRF